MQTSAPHNPPTAGFCIVHGNRLEDLTDLLVAWLGQQPLRPLEPEVFLVQSSGMAQWLKLALAQDAAAGIAAAQRFEMPASFLWNAYRAVLGPDQVPTTSPYDKSRLTWRLMRLLPDLLGQPDFAPLARFLSDDQDQRKRFQLAERLADLFDQYQVYRADWLTTWEAGDDRLPQHPGEAGIPLGDQRWQAMLWRALVNDMPDATRHMSRAHLHQRFCQALQDAAEPPAGLPSRIVVFGLSSLPQQMLQALHELSPYSQILLLVLNPCGHYWGDIIEDRELLRHRQQRHSTKPALQQVEEDIRHRHANPLLASWGKQGRDYIGLLYGYDLPDQYAGWFQDIDLFQPPEPRHLLGALQRSIFDLEGAPADPELRPVDDSVRFHLAHSPQREVEVLHDQLLRLFETASARGAPLQPRDVIVMVPDIETYAPHIEAVFGNRAHDDPDHLPFSISDHSLRHQQPMAGAIEQLLNLPELRLTLTDLLELLEVPALRHRFAIDETALPLLRDWALGAGVRWGLHADQRAALGLPNNLEQNSWRFGLRRMLLGYATGQSAAWRDIEPYAEVGGLQAELAGKLVDLIDALDRWWYLLSQPATVPDWSERLQAMLDTFFSASSDQDLALQAELLETLEHWQTACAEAGFNDTVPLHLARQSWIDTLAMSRQSQRFLAGRINFCTLMPMRSIPFRIVCLLGMNDTDYPRRQMPQDFDLMAQRGQYRPGDRSRRDDDRYLFLEALLSARDHLYISWVGRTVRDNEPQPPSVLVAQLRDFLDACWRINKGASEHLPSEALTLTHPLQPFSADYFNGSDPELFTYAQDWRAALEHVDTESHGRLPEPSQVQPRRLTPAELGQFLRAPVTQFFAEQLQVRFDALDAADDHAEPFTLAGLDEHQVLTTLLDAALDLSSEDATQALQRAKLSLQRTGTLPLPPFANPLLDPLLEDADIVLARWRDLRHHYPHSEPLRELSFQWSKPGGSAALTIEHWQPGLRSDGNGNFLLAALTASKLKDRQDNALSLWVIHLLACANELQLTTVQVGRDLQRQFAPLSATSAKQYLDEICSAWWENQCQPLPLAPRTGFAWLKQQRKDGKSPLSSAQAQYESGFRIGEVDYSNSTAFKRAWPDFAALTAQHIGNQSAFEHWADLLYGPLYDHHEEVKH